MKRELISLDVRLMLLLKLRLKSDRHLFPVNVINLISNLRCHYTCTKNTIVNTEIVSADVCCQFLMKEARLKNFRCNII
ncbi:hypothetical protein [Anabaena sp. UHCC 0399]|uniref:hypothetical protein n=1 Tax=Anabaena sp. UHCC 0399 TaxID=3110238 RepID=UPI002B213AFA|nr:hypothetical protein [Anabaena sp. UHCC 0399]MEA5564767.1 hypothetical protein [Anabaena sp. UHCC 0399]